MSQSNDDSWYNYGLSNNTLTNEWKTYSNRIEGVITNGLTWFNKFRPGTKYVKFLCLIYKNDGEEKVTVDMKDIIFEEVE